MNYFSYLCIRNGDLGVWCILTASRPGFQFLLVLVIPVPSRRRFGTVSFSPESTISAQDDLHLQPAPQTSTQPKFDTSTASTHFTPRERCRAQIPTVRFYHPNPRKSILPHIPPPLLLTSQKHRNSYADRSNRRTGELTTWRTGDIRPGDILSFIHILLLFYCGWAHMEFLFALALGGQQDRPAPRRTPSSPHPYGGMGKGNGSLDSAPPAGCLQVGPGCAPGLRLDHDSDCVVGKPSQVEHRQPASGPAWSWPRPWGRHFATDLCHRPLDLARPRPPNFFRSIDPSLILNWLRPFPPSILHPV